MKQILLTLITLMVSACSFTNNDAAYPNPSYPNPAGTEDYLPRPDDMNLTRGNAFLDSADLLTMESFPLQFSVNFKGNLPTPCHQLRIKANPPDAENNILMEVYSVVNAEAVCAQVLEPFDVTFALGSYPAGHYILFVNGPQVAEFDA